MEETLRILVVDDDEVDRMAVRRSLNAAGLKIDLTEAWDYTSAIATLQAAKDNPFDCIFLDYRLPDQDGLILVKDLRRDGSRTPLVVLTGQGDERIAVELMKAGATDYLPKSKVSAEALLQIVRNVIRINRAELEAERANQQREQLARQREDFVYRLTHDLRTPLVAADRMLTLFQQKTFGPVTQDMEEALAIMIHSNQNLLQMVNTILEVYRHDAGYKTLSFTACDLKPLVQEVIQELRPLVDEKGLMLSIDGNQDEEVAKIVTTVMGDRLELRRVVSNMIGNAIKYTDQGSITVRLIGSPIKSISDAEITPHHVTLEVQDTGIGISTNDQKMLFERFRQGENNNKRAGSGLGLYLSRRIVEAHAGTIEAESEPGKGSLFRVRLPIQ